MYCTAPLSPPKGRLTSFHDDDDDDDDDASYENVALLANSLIQGSHKLVRKKFKDFCIVFKDTFYTMFGIVIHF